MKIIIVLGSASYVGVAKNSLQHAKQLVTMGHEVLLVAPSFSSIPSQDQSTRHQPQASDSLSLTNHTDLPCLFVEPNSALTDTNLPSADILLATDCDTAHWIAPLESTKGFPVHFVQHYDARTASLNYHLPSAYKLPMAHIVVSSWLGAILQMRYGANVVAVVPNGITLEQEAPVQRQQPPHPTVGLRLNASDPEAHTVVQKVITMLHKRLPTVQVLVDGNLTSVASEDLPKGSAFYHSAESPIQTQCDVWLYYHSVNDFADEIVQAFAHGTPVVATTSGDAQTLLANGGGRLVSIDDKGAMCNELLEICTLPQAQWQKMSDEAYQTALSYRWPAVGHKLSAALTTCLEQAKSTGISTSNTLV